MEADLSLCIPMQGGTQHFKLKRIGDFYYLKSFESHKLLHNACDDFSKEGLYDNVSYVKFLKDQEAKLGSGKRLSIPGNRQNPSQFGANSRSRSKSKGRTTIEKTCFQPIQPAMSPKLESMGSIDSNKLDSSKLIQRNGSLFRV